MQVALPPLDLADRFKIVVDPDATPADLDAAVARFLLQLADKWKSNTTPAGTPAAEVVSLLPEFIERLVP